eukprot:scaffold6448_cov124-Isochrysis_galbana.AAC.4
MRRKCIASHQPSAGAGRGLLRRTRCSAPGCPMRRTKRSIFVLDDQCSGCADERLRWRSATEEQTNRHGPRDHRQVRRLVSVRVRSGRHGVPSNHRNRAWISFLLLRVRELSGRHR